MRFDNCVLIRGGGDLATGVALRLHRAGINILITELAQPLAVRRAVSFCEAVYEGAHTVEGVTAKLVEASQLEPWKARAEFSRSEADVIPVIIDPEASILSTFQFPVIVDARLIKTPPQPLPTLIPLHIGLGPGFTAGSDCHAVIETRRSHTLGRVYWQGPTQPDSGEPDGDPRRVLRASADGMLVGKKNIGDHCEEGDVIAEIKIDSNTRVQVCSPFKGVLRGIIRDGLKVTRGLKIGDVDARNEASACFLVSDKSLSIGGGVLEAVLTRPDIRKKLYSA
ncbi:MAG: selenium-dependent molybdenum cofactor biosynthesis protein YqeB [Anaerolineales bacterium]